MSNVSTSYIKGKLLKLKRQAARYKAMLTMGPKRRSKASEIANKNRRK